MNLFDLREGLYWGSASKVLNVILGIASTFVLAGYLSPEDFGIAAIAIAAFQGMQLFRDGGLSTSIVADQDRSQALINTGATVLLALGIVVFSMCILAAPLLASFLADERLTDAIRVISLALIFISLSTIHSALAQKSLRFKKLFQPNIYGRTSLAVISIGGAVMGLGYWSIVVGIVASSCIRMVVCRIVFPVSYSLQIDRNCLRRLFSFSILIFCNMLILFILKHGDRVVIGKLISMEQVGYYHFGVQLANLQAEFLYPILTVLLLPYFSKLDLVELRNRYIETLRYLRLIIIPFSFYLVLIAEPAFIWIYADKWLPVLPILYSYCIFGIIRALIGPQSVYLYAKRKPGVMTFFLLIRLAISYSLIYIFQAQLDATRVALIFTGALLLNFVLWAAYLHVTTDIRAGRYLGHIVGPLLASGGAFLIARWLLESWPVDSLAQLIISSAVFVPLVGGIYWKVYRGELQKLLNLVMPKAARAV